MADIVARDDNSVPQSGAPTASAGTTSQPAPGGRQEQPPRSDVGTLVLHWVTAIAFIVSLFTGIRIAADAVNAPVSHWLSPILPQGEIWSWHFIAGLTLFFAGSAYVAYLWRAGLASRNALKKTRVMLMPVAKRMWFGALNVLLHWAAYLIIVMMTVTGVFLYLGYGGWLVQVHSYTAFVGLGYIFVHIIAHYLFGGWWQVFRVFRPAKLALTQAVKPKPVLVALAIGAAITAAVAATDWATRDTLVIAKVSGEPKLDAVLDDPVWNAARPVRIFTQQGENFGGTGESTVEVRAVHNGSKVFFAFKWTDPTRSLRRIPIVKKADGWHVADTRTDRMDVIDFYEDKLAIIFSEQPALGGAGVTHLGAKPISGKPGPLNERGFHFTTDGSIVDLWQWKASRGGMIGVVDDQYMGPPYEPSAAEKAGTARYQGGYWNDPGKAFYSYNYRAIPKGHVGPIQVVRLPKDLKAQVAALGKFDLKPDSVDDENGRWFMYENESVPYSAELDAQIPVGTVLPGVLIMGDYEGDRAHLKGASVWKDGHWYLEVVRDLKTGSKFDKDFVPGRDLYMWVSVFDHVQTRHSRHPRPVRVVTQP